jgi:hypothetical protein
MKAIYWVIAVAVVGIVSFIYILLGDTQKTIPKIKLSYFVDEKEIAQSIDKRLAQEIAQNNFFWIGVEPGKTEQLEVVLKMKAELEKTKPFRTVILDKELELPQAWIEKFKAIEVVSVKESLSAMGELFAQFEKNKERYLLITASLYSSPLVKKNQLNQMKEKYKIWPMTFSLAYFPVTAELEKEMLFPCLTEDHSGVSDWGCVVVNKVCFTRCKVDEQNPKAWIGLMDLIGEKDYMVLLRKK